MQYVPFGKGISSSARRFTFRIERKSFQTDLFSMKNIVYLQRIQHDNLVDRVRSARREKNPKKFEITQLKIHCGVEQLVARRAHNPKVARSSRVPATKKKSAVTKVTALFLFPSRSNPNSHFFISAFL
jgi:hypothetical protein